MSRRLRSALSASSPMSPPASSSMSPPTAAGPAAGPELMPAEMMPSPLILDLVAALVQGGAPPRAALRSVGEALQAMGDRRGDELLAASTRIGRPITATATGPEPAPAERLTAVLEEALWLAARSGLPPTALLRRCAAEERRRRNAAQLGAIRRLEVLLVVPAGLCLLPAFVLLGVVPVVLDLILG
jgi:hypothetical protein